MNLSKYEAFLKCEELGSLTKAAEALGYTQSGISHMLNALEDELGLPVLERGRGGVHLTANGALLLPEIRALLRQNAQLEQTVAHIKGLEAGLVRVGAFTSVGVHYLPHILKGFAAQYPHIEFSFVYGDYSDLEAWVDEGRVDCAFLRLPTVRPLRSTPLQQSDHILAVLPPDHPLTVQARVTLAQVAAEPFIGLHEEKTTDSILSMLQRSGVRPSLRFSLPDDYSVLAMVEAGLGVSVLPELVIRGTSFRVITRDFDPPLIRQIGVVTRLQGEPSPATQRFIEHVTQPR